MTNASASAVPSDAFDVVAFGPHPDDVELFAGGLVAKLVQLGHRVAIVDLTRGELASRGTVDEREREAAEAALVLGVARRVNLALPDGGLRVGDDEQVARVANCLRELRPELAIAPCAVERHPDHEAAHDLVRRAVFLAGLRKWLQPPDDLRQPAPHAGAAHRPRTVLWYPMRHAEKPSFIVDVSAHYATKRRAIACHASQVGPAPPDTATLMSSPLSLSSLEARDAFYGAQIGVAHGEPYLVDEALSVDDPVAHFRGRPAALFFPARSGRSETSR